MAIIYQPYDLGRELDPSEIPLGYGQEPDDDAALRLVVKDLQLAEYYLLAKGMTVSWDRADRLFLFRMPQAFWEGSSVPRASLGIPLIFEHVESLMPQIMSGLFSDSPPFDVVAKGQSKPQTARAVRTLIAAQLHSMGFEEQARLGLKESLVYGTGIWKYGFAEKEKHMLKYEWADVPEARSVGLGTVMLPTRHSNEVKETLEQYTYHEPWFERIHIRFAVPDPALREPDIRKARYVAHRSYPDLEDLEALRNQPGYKLPPTDYLQSLFRPPRESPERSLLEGRSTSSVLNTGISSLDINMEFKAAPRWQDPSRDPNLQPLEMVEYTTPTKVITVLNRKLVIKNDANPLNKLNYLSTTFADVIDSFYGLGLATLLAGEQRLQQGVINSRLDDLALRLSGTFLRTRGANTPTQQLRMRPGGIIDTDDVKGVQMIQYPPALMDAFTEIEASDSRAQRRTGANQLVTSGTAPGAGQLGRTSAGVQTANQALGMRMGYWLDQITSYMFRPFLEAMHEMNQLWLPQKEIADFFQDELDEDSPNDPLDIKNATLKFEMLAGSKLKTRMSMMQITPQLVQLFALQPVIEAISAQQLKVDWVELVQAMLDAVSWPGAQKFISEMTPQDQQQQQQKNAMLQQSNQIALKHKAAMEEIEMKGRSQAGTHIIRGLVDHMGPQAQAQAAMAMMGGGPDAGQQDAQGQGGPPGGAGQGPPPGGQGGQGQQGP
jgi:hypothetical protein